MFVFINSMTNRNLNNSSTEQLHLFHIDSLRALAALYVVCHHIYLQFDKLERQTNEIFGKILLVFSFGHYSVDVFIVLSGFCLMIPVIRNNYQIRGGSRDFLKKRARRILPPYFFSIGLSLVLIYFFIGKRTGTHWDVCIPVTYKDVLIHSLLIHDVFIDTSSKINHSLWSIAVEWRIYLFFPLLVLAWRKIGAYSTCTLIMAISIIIVLGLMRVNKSCDNLNLLPWGICPHFLLLFTLGMLAADIALSGKAHYYWKQSFPWRTFCILCAIIIIILTIIDFVGAYEIPFEFTDVFVGFFSACLLVLLTYTINTNEKTFLLNRMILWKPLVFIGTFSYSIYLIHAPLIQLFCQYVFFKLKYGFVLSFIAICLVGVPAIVGVSYLFFLCFERPFITKKSLAAYRELPYK